MSGIQAALIGTFGNIGFGGNGQITILTSNAASWVVPDGITQISILCVGAGGGASGCPGTGSYPGFGGGGGALAYKNNVAVTPGETLTIAVGEGGAGGASGANPGSDGGNTYVRRGGTDLCHAGGGQGPAVAQATATPGGLVVVGDNSGAGGSGGAHGTVNDGGGGGGGAGGYSGAGGNGGVGNSGTGTGGAGGGGGGGGGISTGGPPATGGGGVGLLGEGTSGTGGATGSPGTGGSSGATGTGAGGLYGAGGSGAEDDTASAGGNGANGAIRIIYSDVVDRFYPTFNTGDLSY